jgi:hypothetical protein
MDVVQVTVGENTYIGRMGDLYTDLVRPEMVAYFLQQWLGPLGSPIFYWASRDHNGGDLRWAAEWYPSDLVITASVPRFVAKKRWVFYHSHIATSFLRGSDEITRILELVIPLTLSFSDESLVHAPF